MECDSIEDLLPYVKHNLKKIHKSILLASRIYFNHAFSSMKVEGLGSIKDLKSSKPDSSLVYVSRHRSHLDYVITQFFLAKAGMPARIQSGDNLFIGPLDPLLRHCGAFMVIRDEHGFYSKNWFLNSVYALFPTSFGPYKKQYKHYIDKKLSKVLYECYLEDLLTNSDSTNDLLVYPEYVRESDGILKYGRSYSGSLLDFSPYIFALIQKISSNVDRDFFFVPVNVSYEQVIEDSFIAQMSELKKDNSKSLLYAKEFLHIASRAFSSSFAPGKAVLKFGVPSEIKKGYAFSSSRSAKRLKHDVGLLETVFSPQIIFYSMDKKSKLSFPDLEDKVLLNLSKLNSLGIDLSSLKDRNRFKSFDVLLEETLPFFDSKVKPFVYVKDNHLCVLDSSITNQYARHISHLF